jgi:hypothetical protein
MCYHLPVSTGILKMHLNRHNNLYFLEGNFNVHTNGKKKLHYLTYEKNIQNNDKQILFFAILFTNLFVTTFHNPLILTSNNVNFSALERHCYSNLN